MRKIILIAILSTANLVSAAQVMPTFKVDLPVSTKQIDVPVNVRLDNYKLPVNSSISLVEINGNKKTPVAFQISTGDDKIISWMVSQEGDQQKHTYQLVNAVPKKYNEIKATEKDGALVINANNKNC